MSPLHLIRCHFPKYGPSCYTGGDEWSRSLISADIFSRRPSAAGVDAAVLFQRSFLRPHSSLQCIAATTTLYRRRTASHIFLIRTPHVTEPTSSGDGIPLSSPFLTKSHASTFAEGTEAFGTLPTIAFSCQIGHSFNPKSNSFGIKPSVFLIKRPLSTSNIRYKNENKWNNF